MAQKGFPSEDSKGVGVASGRCAHQWNQVEINEMVLNMGKGDLRGLSHSPPGPSKQAPPLSPPRPLLAAPLWDPGALQLRTPLLSVTAAPGSGKATAQQRRAFAPGLGILGDGRFRKDAQGFWMGPREGPKLPPGSQRSLDHSISRPTPDTGCSGEGVRPGEPRGPQNGRGQTPVPKSAAESRSLLRLYCPYRQHKHSSVLYSPPN